MSQKYPLQETLSPVDKEGRDRINENWTRIMAYFEHVQGQINLLSGNEDIGELIADLIKATENANISIAEMQSLIAQANTALIDIAAAIFNAGLATSNANAVIATMATLKGELEALQGDLQNIVEAEANRVTNETARSTAEAERVSNETIRKANETTRQENEAARVLVEQARELAEQSRTTTFSSTMQSANEKIAEMLGIIEELDFKGEYDANTTYEAYNVVRLNKSSYVALQQVTGVMPIDDGIHWRILAVGGIDGTGAVDTVNGQTGNVVVDYDSLPNKPTAYPPSQHVHDMSNINGLQGALATKVNDADLTDLEQTVTTHLAKMASTSQAGHVQLNDNTNSTSTTQAATANAVKKVFDSTVKKASGYHAQNDANKIGETSVYTLNATGLNTPPISDGWSTIFTASSYDINARAFQLAQKWNDNTRGLWYRRNDGDADTTWATWTQIVTNKLNWIQGTLQNGWTGNLRYSKNDLGIVVYKFEITCGASPTGVIATIPTGYQIGQIVSFYTAAGQYAFDAMVVNTVYFIRGTTPVQGATYYANVIGLGY
ncbi:tail fiber protein [Lysinibacillus piscis]|uniref:Uncharacterized protein n=1 Tax=Lysinibacillus piscis TaxID=2518931 RepID=A0ABQ5NLY8_9BACI|nr:tail fiber protein [Lysinibacillus sp. KH24]GLC89327.1 hypothetical protein LYSBPC_24540 [Lysinibacillus sp. KH24]